MEQLDWINWKNMSDRVKKSVFQQVLLYYVNPMTEISNIRLINYELFGVKCRTFELELDGETFVFIPGNQEAILGWDLGTQGLRNHELLGADWMQRQKTSQPLPEATLVDETAAWIEAEESYDLNSLEGISLYINDHTSDLRKRKIPAMLVQKYALPAGTNVLGIIDTITGTFRGEVEKYRPFEEEIRSVLFPPLSAAESIFWEYPKTLHKRGRYYLEFVPTTDVYLVYEAYECTYEYLTKNLQQKGYRLLTEDQWEFAVGAGTRRLFRWGNEMLMPPKIHQQQISDKINGPNMFGLVVDTHKSRYELTADKGIVKLERQRPKRTLIENMLPLATYYQPKHYPESEQVLSPDIYLYRKAIIIEL